MNKLPRKELILCGVTALIAAVAIVGWLAKIEVLVKPWSDTAVIQFTTAVGLLGIAIAVPLRETRFRALSYVAVIPTAVIALLSLYGYISGGAVWLDTLLGRPFTEDSISPPGRSSIFTAVSLLFLTVGLVTLPRPKTRGVGALVTATLACASLGIATASTLGHVSGAFAGAGLARAEGISVQTGIGLGLLAIAQLMQAWKTAPHGKHGYPKGFPVPVAVAVLAASLAGFRAIDMREREIASGFAELRAAQTADLLEARIAVAEDSLLRAARLMAEQQEITQREWDNAASDYLSDMPGLVLFDIESGGQVRHANAPGEDGSLSRPAWETAFGSSGSRSEPLVAGLLPGDGPRRLFVASSVRSSTGRPVRVLAVFDLDTFLSRALSGGDADEFSINIEQAGVPVYSRRVDDESDYEFTENVRPVSLAWTLRMTPSTQFLDKRRSSTPESADRKSVV